MWILSGLGGYEALTLIATVVLACGFGRRGLRCLAMFGPLLLISAILPGPDLFGMAMIFGLLLAAFAMGVRWAPHLSASKGEVG